eukprot:3171910-Prymnesium_polylepis.1
MCFLSPFLLLGTTPTTACTVGNSSILALRVPRAISDANKTLAGFDTAAQTCTCDKTFCDWLSAVANFTTALESMECAGAHRVVQAQSACSQKLGINESLKESMSVRRIIEVCDVWDGGMIEPGKQETNRQLQRSILSRTD